MKALPFLLLPLVHLFQCQEHNQMIVFTLQGVLEKLEGINDKLKGYEAIQQKQDEIMDKLLDVQQTLGKFETNFQGESVNNHGSLQKLRHGLEQMKGAAVNSQESLQKLHHELEHVKGAALNNQKSLQRLRQETGQCLRGDDLEHLSNVSAAAHQEIKSFHDEMSGVISLAQKDECSEGRLLCGEIGTCLDTLFSFTCSCTSGFTWDGLDCVDIDECIQGKADCNEYLAVCVNTLGSYSCSCNLPSVGDGRTCSCPPGFALNGNICEDINECAEDTGICHPKATCTNSIGSYSCSCIKPLAGDGRTSCKCPAHQRLRCRMLGLE